MPRNVPPNNAPEKRAQVAERRTRLLELRRQKVPWVECARRLGYRKRNGQPDPAAAAQDLKRALEQHWRRFDQVFQDVVEQELLSLDRLEQLMWEIAEDSHPTLHQGKVVAGVRNVGPNIAATREILAIMQQRARLLGLSKSDANNQPATNLTISIEGVDHMAILG